MQRLLTGRVRFPEFRGMPRSEQAIGSFLQETPYPRVEWRCGPKNHSQALWQGVQPKQENQPGSEDTRYYRRRAGQFIYSKLDFLNGAFGVIPNELDGYESTLDLPAFDMSDEVNPVFFLAYVTRESFYKSHQEKPAVGEGASGDSLTQRISFDHNTSTKAPGADRIAEFLCTCDAEIAAQEQQLALLQQQKRGLMQRLLSGQVRVGKLPGSRRRHAVGRWRA